MPKKKRLHIMRTAEFAELAQVTPRTVRGYCRDIVKGDKNVKKDLREYYGLVSVTRLPDRWIMRVEVRE